MDMAADCICARYNEEDDCGVEGAIRRSRHEWLGSAAQREPTASRNSGGASPCGPSRPAETGRWQHPVVLPQTGCRLGVEPCDLQRILARAGLQPHRVDRYVASNDPDFENKAADIIALYMKPPQHAAVFCVDEKTAIQALDRLDPVLPLSPGRAERHGFEYYRHGTLSLYAALDVKTGKVEGKTTRRHTSADFIQFLTSIVGKTKWVKEIHIVLDNLSAHKTAAVQEFLAANPKVRFHFTPTYSSWLNQVELWFAKIQRDVIDRGIFISVGDLGRKIRIQCYAKTAKPFRWTYTDPSRRIKFTNH